MKIELTLTKDDLAAFYQFHYWYSDERKKYRIKVRLIWGAITAFPYLLILNMDDGEVTSSIGMAIFGLFFFSLGFVASKQTILSSMRRHAEKVSGDKHSSEFTATTNFEFTNDKIIWSSQSGHGQIGIETIKKIKTDEKYYYLYDSLASAYVIPKTTFKTDDEVKEFESVLKRYSQQQRLQI